MIKYLNNKICIEVHSLERYNEDIYSEAMQINAERTSEDSEFEDESETKVDNDAMKTEE